MAIKISFITIGTDIWTIGFRKIASFARSIHPSVEVCYITVLNPKIKYLTNAEQTLVKNGFKFFRDGDRFIVYVRN